MRVLISTTSDISTILLRGQLKFLKDQGIDVHYATIETNISIKFARDEMATLHHIPFTREIDLKCDLLALKECIAVLKRIQPDIINAGTPKAGLLFMLAAKYTGIGKRVFTLRGLRSETMRGFSHVVMSRMEKLSIQLSHSTIAISPSLKELAIHRFQVDINKLVVLGKGSSNGVKTDFFDRNCIDDELICSLKNKLYNKHTELRCCFIGRITKDKGVEDIVRAVVDSSYNVSLLLVGDFEMENSVSEEILSLIHSNSKIRTVGFQDDIRPYVCSADINILFSRREGFGNSVIEAGSLSVPSIVSNIPGLKDTIIHNETGWILPSSDIIELRNLLDQLASDRSTIKNMGRNARKHIISSFSNEVIWKGQLDLYKSLMV